MARRHASASIALVGRHWRSRGSHIDALVVVCASLVLGAVVAAAAPTAAAADGDAVIASYRERIPRLMAPSLMRWAATLSVIIEVVAGTAWFMRRRAAGKATA